MREILTIVGARPQFVKAAVFSRFVRQEAYQGRVRETLVHTGQHYDDNMSAVFFREMLIPDPDINLNIGSGGHGATTGAMLAGLERLLVERRPDLVLVYGDTNSTLAGALAAAKLHLPVAHVEAGLRSFMMAMPEEQNRRLADHLATWLFCPTATAVRNLAAEGITHQAGAAPGPDRKAVLLSGDIMLDASLYYRARLAGIPGALPAGLPRRYYLLTIHRAENTDDPARLRAIVSAINARPDLAAVFPIHPRTRKLLAGLGLHFAPHVRTIEPVGYFDMLRLEEGCSFVVTDSGGVQKEAFFFRKPCVTLRDSTEWVELVDSGWNVLAGANPSAILQALDNPPVPAAWPELYGAGDAGRRIAETLLA